MAQRILVIDDERDVREAVEGLIRLIPGCHVEGAATFAEGRSRAREAWDLVISDYALPDGNGLDLLAACATDHPETPRILMTAFGDHPAVRAALDTPMLTEFIQKPFDPEAVLDRVEQLLRRRQAAP